MEPVTHILTGACLARAGCNRKAAYATLAMAVAAEFPDIDTLWSIGGPVASFEHHRGWTHTLLGLPFEATFLVLLVWLLHRWRTRHGGITAAPVRFGLLWCFVLLALLSHIFLDWTNNYGVRPFFPFNPHWYAGSFVFIFEPVLFVFLLGGLVLPSLFGLINSEVGARKPAFRGRGWAVAALLGACALWGWRAFEHSKAVQTAHLDFDAIPVPPHPHDPGTLETVLYPATTRINSISASPYPIDPYHWHVIIDTPELYQTQTFDTRTGLAEPLTPTDTIFKSAPTLATLAAKRSWLGQAYLDWSQYPVVSQTSPDPNPNGPVTVTFQDLRFLYDTPLLKMRGRAPLTGTVFLDPNHRVERMELDGRAQR
ncbi:inner membrane protein [Granulicella rosea]|uniref:Inner membrane protein n=1 Tax=Granulicella rosea TaxID=474952 RepID=A0A239D2L2_9BACT|nr:metal-dependent hydrolase [Granulicella rosea]SNS26064.1 inner membrane protein [Granulicella rosea]